jgi:lyase family enzyme
VPMTLGQEFSAYATMINQACSHIDDAAHELLDISLGATAIGTGIATPPGYASLVTKRLAECSGLPVRLASDLVEATQDSSAFVEFSGALKRAAVVISKICNDLRLLSSGPRAGLNEINLPPTQPGSSIMPGKVNPVIPEVVNQVCFQLIGYDATISIAAEASQLELNMAEPIIAYDLLHGLLILKNACHSRKSLRERDYRQRRRLSGLCRTLNRRRHRTRPEDRLRARRRNRAGGTGQRTQCLRTRARKGLARRRRARTSARARGDDRPAQAERIGGDACRDSLTAESPRISRWARGRSRLSRQPERLPDHDCYAAKTPVRRRRRRERSRPPSREAITSRGSWRGLG